MRNGYLRCDVLQLAGELEGGLTSHGIIMCSVCGGLQVSLTLVVGLLTVLELWWLNAVLHTVDMYNFTVTLFIAYFNINSAP